MDTAARKLIAEAKDGARQSGQSGSEMRTKPWALATTFQAQVVAANSPW